MGLLMSAHALLIGDSGTAMQSRSSEARHRRLRRIADPFLAHADDFTDQQIGIFDDALGYLIERSESEVLAQLSERLAPVERDSTDTIRPLARDMKLRLPDRSWRSRSL
jgi:hypothetical protein